MRDTIRQQLLDAFGEKTEADQKALAEAIDLLLSKLKEIGCVVVPVSEMIATDVADFEATIKQWVTPTVEHLEEAVDIYVPIEAIVQDLKQKGWHFIPPAGVLTYADVETVIKHRLRVSIGKTDNLVSVDDVPAEAIIQTLRQKGWFLLPPKS